MAVAGIAQIDKSIPFGSHIYWWLRCNTGQGFKTLVRCAEQYERRYLAWEEVRKGGNPYFENGTGFEGYFIGVCSCGEEALKEILGVGHTILTNISRLHRFDPQFQSKLFDTLIDETPNVIAMSEWSAEFGAELARLRCNPLRNPAAMAFNTEIYRVVNSLPHMAYAECGRTIRQHYTIVNLCIKSARIVVSANQFSPSEQDAWQVVQAIGKFGHPLFREFMDLAS